METPVNPRLKTFLSYVYEFVMLFLAVFFGFIAENIREHSAEKQLEKQYVQSLIADLKSDQEILSDHISGVETGISSMDTMIHILNNPAQVSGKTGELYYLARIAPRMRPLSTNNRTFEQLKNSGNFRLIGELAVSNKIMAYYSKLPLVRLLESINDIEFTEYKKVSIKVFEPGIFRSMEGDGDEIKRGDENPALRTSNVELLKDLSACSVYIRGTKKGILRASRNLRAEGKELMEYLQKEYSVD